MKPMKREDIIKETHVVKSKIEALGIVQDYRRVEQQIHSNQSIDERMTRLKKLQKQAVNMQNYSKKQALDQTEARIDEIEAQINTLPIVEEFRESQREANDLLQMMMETLSSRLNHNNTDENK